MHTSRLIATLFAMALIALTPAASAQDGTLDASWFGGGRRTIDAGTSFGHGIAFQSDGKIIVWGNCQPPPGNTYPCLARLFPGGDIDTSFGLDGTGVIQLNQFAGFPESAAVGVVVRSDDSMLIVANHTSVFQGITAARLGWDGDALLWSSSFHFDGSVAQPRSAAVSVTAGENDTMIVAGSTHSPQQLALARITVDADGLPALDAQFADAGVRLLPFASILMMKMGDVRATPDGKLLVLFKHRPIPGNPDFGTLSIRRYLANGDLDTGFSERVIPNCAGADGIFSERLALDAAGRIAVAWTAWYPAAGNPPSDICVDRLLPSGAQDPSFGGLAFLGIPPGPLAINIGLEQAPNFSQESFGDLAVGADGKIIIGGIYIGTAPSCVGCAMSVRLRESPFIGHALDLSYGNNGVALWQYAATSNFDWISGIEIAQGGLLVAGRASNFADGAVPILAAAKLRLGPTAFEPIFSNGFEDPLKP